MEPPISRNTHICQAGHQREAGVIRAPGMLVIYPVLPLALASAVPELLRAGHFLASTDTWRFRVIT